MAFDPVPVSDDPYDEERDDGGAPRQGYAAAFEALDGCDLDDLRRAVASRLEGRGVSFGGDPFVIDPVPRLIPADDWDALAAGLAQRAGALNALLRDAYGERRIVQAGVIDAAMIEQAQGFEPQLQGRLPAQARLAPIIGFDVVRDPGGEFLVLEDNLRTPSGFAYALAAREALRDALPPGMPASRAIDPLAYEMLAAALRAAAPAALLLGAVHRGAHRRPGERRVLRARAGREPGGRHPGDARRPRRRRRPCARAAARR